MIILDTSVWIALLKSDDSCHKKAKAMVKKVHPSELKIFDHVFAKTLTVLRNKVSNNSCQNFIKFLAESHISVLLSNERSFNLATVYFTEHPKLSFVDAIVLASSKVYNARILTFDKNLQLAWEKIQK